MKNNYGIKVRIDRLLEDEGKLKAFASLTLGDTFAVHGIRIIETDKGLFPSMPSRSYKSGEDTKYADIFHAVTSEARAELDKAIVSAYEQAVSEQMEETGTIMSQQM